jgi:hypothetical protein
MVSMDYADYVASLIDEGQCDAAREVLRAEESSLPVQAAQELWRDLRDKERLLGI